MKGYTHNTACRVCSGTDLLKVLDLGTTPPANAYLKKEDLEAPEASYPLVLYYCRTCSLLQLLDVVDPAILFKGYHFLTSASVPSVEHFWHYAENAIKPLLSSNDDLVVDIGGNDGTLLSFLSKKVRVLNVDPADNLAPLSQEKGVPFHPAFFTAAVAGGLLAKYGPAKVIVANNVFAHTDPLRDVFAGVSTLLRDDGVFIFEVHWAKHLLETKCFDQIYHEHLCFWSLKAAKRLVELSGMRVFRVEVVPMQGLSLRVYAAKGRAEESSVAAVLVEEAKAGVSDEAALARFAEGVRSNKEVLLSLVATLKAQGKRIVGYGAPAKGNTLLNFYGIGPETLEYITDTTPHKQGLYTPGTHIPIVAPKKLMTDTPDYLLLLAWNFKDFILEKEQALRERGTKFIVTIPKVEVL